MAPDSVGHRYRVLNHAEALEKIGFDVQIASPDQVGSLLDTFVDLHALIVFRPRCNESFVQWRHWADRNGVLFLLDLDDLTFDVACFQSGQWSFWAALPNKEQEHWRELFESQRHAVLASDGVLVSTEPLAQAVQALHRPAWVWPNGFGRQSWHWFQQARQAGPLYRSPDPEGAITVGYASGTPTHEADFGVVAAALARLMHQYSKLRLCLIGWLDPTSFSVLRGLEDRIERRPLVPYDQLAAEYARFDINLAPLEEHSAFCRCKSALKFFEAAAVGVPTVATPTPPFTALMRHRWNGCLAVSSDDWFREIAWLIERRRRRIFLAYAASFTIRCRCSPWAQRRDLRRILRQSALR